MLYGKPKVNCQKHNRNGYRPSRRKESSILEVFEEVKYVRGSKITLTRVLVQRLL